MSQPFCQEVRDVVIKSAKKFTEVFEGVYLATEGPRLETKAEIKMFSKFAHVVGMTLVPEVILAREKGMCYASICLVSNMAAGLQEELPADEIAKIYEKKKDIVIKIIEEAINEIPKKRKCSCGEAVKKGKIG
ncbi:MAG: MTAP family purine nucleoside phosphorylase [Thermoplasmata archaeon]|nr:MAG: MTAP family purine nucleoside phosphorylase [Thermoplasmata archaeon]